MADAYRVTSLPSTPGLDDAPPAFGSAPSRTGAFHVPPPLVSPPRHIGAAATFPVGTVSPTESPPSTAHLAQIADARRRGRAIRRAAVMAGFNGWTLAAFAAITLLCGMHSLWGIVTGLALAG